MSGLKSVLDQFSSNSPIFPNNAGVLVKALESTRVGKALEMMINNKISSVPVIDSTTGDALYFLTLLDLMTFLLASMSEEDVKHSLLRKLTSWIKDDVKDAENATLGEVYERLSKTGTPVGVRISQETSVRHAVELMLKRHSNRALIADKENKNHPVSVLSMSRVLELMAPFVGEIPAHSKTLRQLGLGNPYCITVRTSDSAYNAFKRMTSHYVGSVAVVNDKGELVGNISASDFKVMHFEDNYWGLIGKDVESYLDAVRKNAFITHEKNGVWRDGDSTLLFLTPDSTLAETAMLMQKFKIHHVYIVDPQTKHPIGVVSNRDVVREIMQNL